MACLSQANGDDFNIWGMGPPNGFIAKTRILSILMKIEEKKTSNIKDTVVLIKNDSHLVFKKNDTLSYPK